MKKIIFFLIVLIAFLISGCVKENQLPESFSIEIKFGGCTSGGSCHHSESLLKFEDNKIVKGTFTQTERVKGNCELNLESLIWINEENGKTCDNNYNYSHYLPPITKSEIQEKIDSGSYKTIDEDGGCRGYFPTCYKLIHTN